MSRTIIVSMMVRCGEDYESGGYQVWGRMRRKCGWILFAVGSGWSFALR